MNLQRAMWCGVSLVLGCLTATGDEPGPFARIELRGQLNRLQEDPIRRPSEVEYMVLVGPFKERNLYYLDLSTAELRERAKALAGVTVVVKGDVKLLRVPDGPREGELRRVVVRVSEIKRAEPPKK
jgi:hypothetical protein